MALSDPTVIASFVAGAAALAGTAITIRMKWRENKIDLASVTLASQLAGWDTYSKSLRARIGELEEDNRRCNVRVQALTDKNDALETRCDNLEDDIIKLRREMAAIRHSQESPKNPEG